MNCKLVVLSSTLVSLAACGSGSKDTPDGGAGHDAASAQPDAKPFVPASHIAYPQVNIVGDGTELPNMKIVTIVASNDGYVTKLAQFGDDLVASTWWTSVSSEWSLGQATNVTVVGPAITADVSYQDVQDYIDALITSGDAPDLDGHTTYLLFLPTMVNIVDPSKGANTQCHLYEGAHFQFHGGPDQWTFAQRCYGDTDYGINDSTNTASHEIIESATDPHGGGIGLPFPDLSTPWLDNSPWQFLDGGWVSEVGDLCIGENWIESGFQFQRSWSNTAAAAGGNPCLPALSEPYYNVAPDQNWSAVSAGGTVDIPLTGWSTGPTSDWEVFAYELMSSTTGEMSPSVSTARTLKVAGATYPVVNNGEVATLHVHAPPTASSGDWATFIMYIVSTKTSSKDAFHIWPVGVYVP